MSMDTLYISDLDGTLLNEEGELSSRTTEVINRLTDAGIYFTYATARSFSSASKIVGGLRLSIPVITYNGTFFVGHDDGRILYSLHFNEAVKDLVKEVTGRMKCYPLVYSILDGRERVSYLKDQVSPGILRYLESRTGDARLRPVMDTAALYQGENYYYTMIDSQERLEPVKRELISRDTGGGPFVHTFQEEIYCRGEYWLELMPEGATKAEGAKRLMELTGCSRMVCFGDAVNDIPMFREADEAYAVANAAEELKQHADGIILSNREDGVAVWLEQHVKI